MRVLVRIFPHVCYARDHPVHYGGYVALGVTLRRSPRHSRHGRTYCWPRPRSKNEPQATFAEWDGLHPVWMTCS